MRGYWVKIALKALGIFAVGMILVTGFRKAKGSINHAINSSDPIPLPLIGMIPFNLDNAKMGSVSRVEFLRSDPEHLSGVRVIVKLSDSIPAERLSTCQLALDDVERINDQTTFRCAEPGQSIEGLAPFGVVAVKNSSDTFPLLLPAGTIARLKETSFSFRDGKFKIDAPPSSGEMMASRVDSLHHEVEMLIDAQSDSVDHLKELSSDLEDSAADAPRDKRRAIQHSADSVRALMRSMVDRMKANEGRLQALDKLTMIRELRHNNGPIDGAAISDSVQKVVNAELSRVQAELERQGITNVRVNVQLDSASAAAMREGMDRRGARASSRGSRATGVGQNAGGVTVEAPAPAEAPKPPKPVPTPKRTPQVEATP